jgi:hypothetical protein
METTLVLEDVQKQDEFEFLFGKLNSAEDSESLSTWEHENLDYWEMWYLAIDQ